MKARRIIAVTAALALTSLTGLAAPGSAQNAQQEVATVQKEAFFARSITTAVPPLLLEGFPPSTVCLVAGLVNLPQLCGEDVSDAANTVGISDGLPIPELIDADIIQPVVLPGTLPVGMFAGQERYASALQFQVPVLEEGQTFGSFELLLREDGVGFAAESPFFRAFVFAAISQIQERNPEAFVDVLTRLLEGEVAAIAETITGIEACPTLEPWEEGDAQNAGNDGRRLPEVDCLVGTTGAFDKSNSSWVFDLTFAAQAWSTGGITGETLTNQGILLRPLGAENLAYGDPDLSTNWLVSLAGADAAPDLQPRIRYTVLSESAPPAEVVEPITPSPDLGPTPVPDVAAPDLGPLPQPEVATPSPGGNVTSGAINARWAERASSRTGDSSTPWLLLLLIPLGLAGAWMVGEAALAGPAATGHRQGALDELVRRQGDLP